MRLDGPDMKIRSRKGFTLLELLTAAAISAVLLGSLYMVLHGALKLRERTFDEVESGLPRLSMNLVIRRDLINMAAPVGLLAGPVIGDTEEAQGFRRDHLEFYTTSGITSEKAPWGDIQKVEYFLEEPEDGEPDKEGLNLVRAVTRNLLASTVEEPEETVLARGVESLEITYFDGTVWQDSWDSTGMDNAAPKAVKIRADFIPETEDEAEKPSLELLCEVVAQGAASP